MELLLPDDIPMEIRRYLECIEENKYSDEDYNFRLHEYDELLRELGIPCNR